MVEKLKLVSWNVNGIRAVIKKDFIESLKKLNADIVCIQETKAHKEQVDHELNNLAYKYEYWNSAERKGYSSVAVFSKKKPMSVDFGIGHELDNEGRVITLEFENFYLVTVYTPNSKDDLSRLSIRYNEWDKLFLKHCKKLEKKKPVVICGDLNVAHEEIDVKNDKANRTTDRKPGSAGFTDQERERFSDFLKAGFMDTFRYLHPNEEKFSWWSYRGAARDRNVGWRLDYFLISNSLKNNLREADIDTDIYGSDHCPVHINLIFD